MQLVKDSVVEGKVTGILKFGAFVDLGEGKSGMVHISEVSNDYVEDIKDVLKVGQTVKVRVISVADDGKIALSIRKADKNNSDRDFKKKNGYKRSVELSEKYGLYRQDYCGCIFSRAERDRRKAAGQPTDAVTVPREAAL